MDSNSKNQTYYAGHSHPNTPSQAPLQSPTHAHPLQRAASEQPPQTPLPTIQRRASISPADNYECWTDNYNILKWQNEIAANQDVVHRRRISETHQAHPMNAVPEQKKKAVEEWMKKQENVRLGGSGGSPAKGG